MAPQVPYNGAPSVDLQNNPTPTLHEDTPIAAFGGLSAAAEQNVGKSLEGAGNELFTRAVAMQDLYNSSQATEADAKYMESAGNIRAKLDSMQGKDAVDYFTNGFQNDLKGARQSIRDSLPNDMARKLFDRSSLYTYGRTVNNGAEIAGHANKAYAIGAAQASVKNLTNFGIQNPDDDEAFGQLLDKTEQTVRAQYGSGLQAASPEVADAAVAQAKSNLWYNRISLEAQKSPFEAEKMLAKAFSDNAIGLEDRSKLTAVVNTAMRTTGARNIQHQVTSGADWSWGSGKVDLVRARDAIGAFESHNQYNTYNPKFVVTDKSGNTGTPLGRYQVMSYNLPAWLKQAGLPSMTPEQFVADPKAQDQVFDTVFGGYMQKYGSFNAATKAWFGGEGSANADPAKLTDNFHNGAQYLTATNASLARTAGVQAQVARGRQVATEQNPNDPLLGDYVEQRIVSQNSLDRRMQLETAYQNKATIDDAIIQGGPDGKPFANIDELRQFSPSADVAYSQLPSPKQIQIQRDVASYYAAATKVTQKASADYLRGLMYGSDEDHQKFIDTNIYQLPLSQSDMRAFTSAQKEWMKDAGGDTTIHQALQMIGPILTAGNVPTGDKELMTKFRGAYVDSIQDWRSQHPGKPLDNATAKLIATGLIRQQSSDRFWYGTDYLFNLPLPKEAEENVRSAQPDVTDAELELKRQQYVRQQFKLLFNKKPVAQ